MKECITPGSLEVVFLGASRLKSLLPHGCTFHNHHPKLGQERLNLVLREAASAGVCGLSNTSPRVEQKAEARQAIRAQKFSFPLTHRMWRLPTASKL